MAPKTLSELSVVRGMRVNLLGPPEVAALGMVSVVGSVKVLAKFLD